MDSINVLIPRAFYPEVKYVFSVLLEEFLGLKVIYKKINSGKEFSILFRQNKVSIKSHFFRNKEFSSIYNQESIPTSISEGELTIGNDTYPILSLYGKVHMIKEGVNYYLDSDIIASTFFMLTRWEEYVKIERDLHNRFSAKSSIAYKFKFLNRPIVNEYVELLWKLIQKIGYRGSRKLKTFNIIPTHDVDDPYLWWNSSQKIKTVLGSLLRLHKFSELRIKWQHLLRKQDPFDTFKLLMDYSEKAEVKSSFFFLVGGTSKFDNRYDIKHSRIKKLTKRIKDRGHVIGLHPSYNAYQNKALFEQEKSILEEVVEQEIKVGRHHYLRFDIPSTFRIWEDFNMEWDSSLSYADVSGFRCGVCYPFHVFDFLERKKLKLIERPLIQMEASLLNYEKLSIEKAVQKVKTTKETIRKYNGEYVFLWHNSSFHFGNYLGSELLLKEMYKRHF